MLLVISRTSETFTKWPTLLFRLAVFTNIKNKQIEKTLAWVTQRTKEIHINSSTLKSYHGQNIIEEYFEVLEVNVTSRLQKKLPNAYNNNNIIICIYNICWSMDRLFPETVLVFMIWGWQLAFYFEDLWCFLGSVNTRVVVLFTLLLHRPTLLEVLRKVPTCWMNNVDNNIKGLKN
jgi:hypothetical protein